jgi:hypothetical protein
MSEKLKKSGRLQRGEPPTFRVMITHTKATITILAWFMETLKKRAAYMASLF